MLYVCIPSYNEAPTIGLLLWKIRQTFTAFPREYQLLVADDASTDATSEVLEPYTRVLPLTVLRHAERRGYAASSTAARTWWWRKHRCAGSLPGPGGWYAAGVPGCSDEPSARPGCPMCCPGLSRSGW